MYKAVIVTDCFFLNLAAGMFDKTLITHSLVTKNNIY